MSLPNSPDEISVLTLDQRFELAELLLNSVAADPNRFELTDEWKAELDRRSVAHDASPADAIPWDVVVAEARARAGR